MIFDEFTRQNVSTQELIQVVKSKPYQVDSYFCDPAGSGVNIQSGLSDVQLFRQNGIKLKYTNKPSLRAITAGVELVRQLVMTADNKIRLFVDNSCKRLIQDFMNYRYPQKKESGILSELPLKDGIHDHTMDALRYIVINRFGSKGVRVEPIERRSVGL